MKSSPPQQSAIEPNSVVANLIHRDTIHYMDITLLDKFNTDNFWSNVPDRIDGKCWLWAASVDTHGYPKYSFRHGRQLYTWLAHRMSFALLHGNIPTGLCVCHTCDIPRCVNPEHLWLGTHKQNCDDKIAKGRAGKAQPNPRRGQYSRQAKLNDEKVRQIRKQRLAGVSINAMAKEYDVSCSLIAWVVQRKSWAHVE